MSENGSQTCSRDFPGTIAAASDAEAWLLSQSSALGLAADTEFAINVCLEELFLNAVQHGLANRTRVSISAGSDAVKVEFIDDGKPFDPASAPAKRATEREAFEIGGYGTGLVRKFSRRMTYARTDGQNRLVLEFDPGQNA